MLCPFCGSYSDSDDIVCPGCGKLLPRGENRDTGVMAIRQGRRAREDAASGKTPIWMERQGTNRVYVDPDSRPTSSGKIPVYADPEVYADNGDTGARLDRGRRNAFSDTAGRPAAAVPARQRRRAVKQSGTNWAHVLLGAIIFMMVLAVGAYFYLRNTANGQRIMARMGRSANSAALWEVGAERMDTGDIDGAIACFEQAMLQDGDENVNVTGLRTLGSAYEAAGRTADAEALYIHIYTDIVPSASDAYSDEIRILMATGRKPEAADLMQTAYRKTGNNSFLQQRRDLLPQQPTVDLTAGFYQEKRHLVLNSPEGYAVFYTFDETAELPAGGVRYADPIFLDEGEWHLRAVAVNEEESLVSDELAAVYNVSMPSPQAPYASLAPNTYKQRQRVRLRPGVDNLEDKDITIYYTIDGSIPDADSPIYDGTPFWLPGGRVTLKAVAVNGYGKASHMLEILYKIEAKPYPKDSYTTDDTAGITLNNTTYEDFTKAYGESTGQQDVTKERISNPCRRYEYPWGWAVFQRVRGTQYLIEVYFTGGGIKGPRSTGIGNDEDYVVGKFRDMGQVASPSGNRGLYENGDGTGKIFQQEDGTRIIRYQAYTADSHIWLLEYIVGTSGSVTAIHMEYIP